MFQSFNSTNLVTKFVKDLLKTTYVPTVGVWKPGKYLIKDFIYITSGYIVKANKNYDPENDSNKVESIYAKDERGKPYFTILEPYVEGKFYRGITSNYESNTSSYDSTTHYYLGEYLRLARDIHNIDLMPYYNCWSGQFLNNISIKGGSIKTETNIASKVAVIPIKYNQTYTIYIDSDTPISMITCYYDGTTISPTNKIDSTYQTKARASFNEPFTYKVKVSGSIGESSNNNLSLNERYLTLLIQLSNINATNIVILEGNYSKTNIINNSTQVNELPSIYFGTDDKGKSILPNLDLNNYLCSVSSLTRSINASYAFNDRLIEYLLWNVITRDDVIDQNIKLVQREAELNKTLINVQDQNGSINKKIVPYTYPSIRGIWDNNLRYYLYTLATKNVKTPLFLDVNGFVDKDVEDILRKGKSIK